MLHETDSPSSCILVSVYGSSVRVMLLNRMTPRELEDEEVLVVEGQPMPAVYL